MAQIKGVQERALKWEALFSSIQSPVTIISPPQTPPRPEPTTQIQAVDTSVIDLGHNGQSGTEIPPQFEEQAGIQGHTTGKERDPSSSARQSPFETLPVEMRGAIFSMTDLDGLWSLTQASHVFFGYFRKDSKRLLCESFQTTQRSVTVDAYAVYLSSSDGFSDARSKEKTDQFLKSYHDLHGQASSSVFKLHEHLTNKGIMAMLAFHCSVVQPFVQ